MNKFEKEIMVIDRSTLFADGYFQGFAPDGEIDYKKIIVENYHYIKRGIAEERPEFKQPIAYCLIMHSETGHIFAYQRAAQEDYHESRLRGKWSWGIGGHIDKIDSEGDDPILTSMEREIEEEVYMEQYEAPEILGYINDDETPVGQVHFGLLFLVKTTARVKPKDAEISWGGFKPYKELAEIVASSDKSVESWSEISLEPLRKYLIKNGYSI